MDSDITGEEEGGAGASGLSKEVQLALHGIYVLLSFMDLDY
jgi:hypothetical protein